ncbi:prepilin-type N-terminal cleavage/methylation domain-containing protein [Natranaerovirga pectinivora]|uniref:Prepilin-type N-terminal cleavage/methylation domain-containing protein n=1 Tax=Natranaerovirga pectinivora TaxID=682400 RepID=A0A4R3MQV1_9FIRM|nr:prepilin-type N-terminal cleavage/methylation domain-containing protein [Natranaerovirga pectinivora]TCT16903.1 prepilin-type N-terminal cleavage/methylation domain-containing protein [Natranaerovirga pectinivora]
MKKDLFNKKGVTLIEIIVVIAIISIVFTLGFSFFSMFINSFFKQADIIDSQRAVNGIIRELDREIRRVDINDISILDNGISVGSLDYKMQGDTLLKNGSILNRGITDFFVTKVGNKITINITIDGKHENSINMEHVIYIREW